VIFFNPALAAGFERRRKRAGQLWSKMRFLSAQLLAYLENDLWLANASHANRMASALAEGLGSLPGVTVLQPVQANEVFAAMPDDLIELLLAEGAVFYRWIDMPGESNPVIRLVTSYATTAQDVERFLALAARHATLATP
jgi:threonine aldolase